MPNHRAVRHAVASALVLVATLAAALAGEPPYVKLAAALGTPALADSYAPSDKSRMLLHFVPKGESAKNWTKMTTVSILVVAPGETDSATRGVIVRLQNALRAQRAKVERFDESPVPPVSAYFEYSVAGALQKGIVYSPDPGFVTVAQVGAKDRNRIRAADVQRLKHILGR